MGALQLSEWTIYLFNWEVRRTATNSRLYNHPEYMVNVLIFRFCMFPASMPVTAVNLDAHNVSSKSHIFRFNGKIR